jgi:hypothetical protein
MRSRTLPPSDSDKEAAGFGPTRGRRHRDDQNERLREQALAAEMAAEEAFMRWIGRGLARIENPKRTRKFWR